jgi:geranylgeranyl pyrophosphate synthase
LQITDDILDFTGTSSVMGKPTVNDVKAGVITCPVLFAANQHPELLPIITRKFCKDGDIDRVLELVQCSNAIQQSRKLAQSFVDRALLCVENFGPTGSEHAAEARKALRELCSRVLDREA